MLFCKPVSQGEVCPDGASEFPRISAAVMIRTDGLLAAEANCKLPVIGEG